MNLWYGLGAQAYISTAFFKAITKNLILSYLTVIETLWVKFINLFQLLCWWMVPGASAVKNPPADAGDARDEDLIPRSGGSAEEGNGNPLQYSCLENPTDRGAWWPTDHGGHKESDTTEQACMHTHTHHYILPWLRVVLWCGMFLKVKLAQSCPTLCFPMDYTVHRILQDRILEWVAFPFSRGSSQARDWN